MTFRVSPAPPSCSRMGANCLRSTFRSHRIPNQRCSRNAVRRTELLINILQMAFYGAGSDLQDHSYFRIGFSRAQPVTDLVFSPGEQGVGGGERRDDRLITDRDGTFTLPPWRDEDGGTGGGRRAKGEGLRTRGICRPMMADPIHQATGNHRAQLQRLPQNAMQGAGGTEKGLNRQNMETVVIRKGASIHLQNVQEMWNHEVNTHPLMIVEISPVPDHTTTEGRVRCDPHIRSK